MFSLVWQWDSDGPDRDEVRIFDVPARSLRVVKEGRPNVRLTMGQMKMLGEMVKYWKNNDEGKKKEL
jgi:hypothetical protein